MISTTSSDTTGEILKQDGRGRVRTLRVQEEKILDQFEGSGRSGKAFAAFIGVTYPTFAVWVQRRGRERRSPQGQPGESPAGQTSCQWIEVVAGGTPPSLSGPLVVHLAGGARMEVRDVAGAALAAEVIVRLAHARPC